MRKRVRARFWAGWAVLALVILVTVWYFTRPNGLREAASRMARAMKDGHARVLFNAVSEQERACSDLDERKIGRAWDLLIRPRIETSKYVRTDPATQSANPTQASAAVWFVDASGTPWGFTMIANQAEDGIKTPVLFSMLMIGTCVDERGHALRASTAESLLAGVRRHRVALESIGLSKIMLSPRSCVSWDELEKKMLDSIEWEKQAAHRESEGAPAKTK